MTQSQASYRLIQHGLILFLLGLGSGILLVLAPDLFRSPRLALSSHVIGTLAGMYLMLLGLIFAWAAPMERKLGGLFWMFHYGTYGNWFGTLLGAFYGTRSLTSAAGADSGALPWQEAAVGLILISSGIAALVATIILLATVRPKPG